MPLTLTAVVVTVGKFNGGTKHNIIPNEVKLQLTVRSTTDEVRDHVLKAIDRTMVIEGVEVTAKTGGKSGSWER